MTITEEITGYMKKVEEFSKDMADDGHALTAYMVELTNVMARVNFVMADEHRKLRELKKKAYLTLNASSIAQKVNYAPSLAKDYIDNVCSEQAFTYELAERCSRLCVHTIDALRTIISSLKAERQYTPHQ